MLIVILNKIFLIIFFMSCLNLIRHSYYFLQAALLSSEEEPRKYKISDISLYLLSISIAYILSVIFTGITI
jgi:hypothetical protein